MSQTLLSCANCGAPLRRHPGDVWPCIHCGALSRVRGDAVELEKKAPDEIVEQVRALVFSGKRDEAIRVAASAGLPESLVEDLSREMAHAILFGQKLNGFGWFIVLVDIAIAVGGYLLVRAEFTAGWVLVVFGALNFLILLRPMVTTLRMARAPLGRATIRRVTKLGVRPLRRPVHLFAFDVDIEPADGSMGFRGSLMVPVREQSLGHAKEGTPIVVRYAPDRSWIRFDRLGV